MQTKSVSVSQHTNSDESGPHCVPSAHVVKAAPVARDRLGRTNNR